MRFLRAASRLILFTTGLLFYIFRYLVGLPWYGHQLSRGMRLRREFLQLLIRLLGVSIEQFGRPATEPGIYVSNHRSYFDPVVILREVLALPVAKHEVRRWPLIGFGLEISGILFVNRSDAASRRSTRKKIGEILRQGYSILIYPEGTTHLNPTTIDFKVGAFKEAAEAVVPIYPVAIAYSEPEDAWIGEDTFFRHFFARFGLRKKKIKISYGPALLGRDFMQLKKEARKWIDAEMQAIAFTPGASTDRPHEEVSKVSA